MSGCCGDISDDDVKKDFPEFKAKVVGSPHLSRDDNKRSGKTVKRGIISKLGASFCSVRNYSFLIYPIVLAFSVFLLFFLRGRIKIKGGNDV